MRRDYETEANRLAKAIDISLDSFTKYLPIGFTKENLEFIIKIHGIWKDSILNPEPRFRTISSLNYTANEVFTYFQESSGETVEYFWEQVAQEKLDYVREDKLKKILARGKIKGLIEFDLVIDSIVGAEQAGRITRQEADQLSKMIGEFESRGKRKASK